MNDLKIISEKYNLQEAKNYRMSIQLNPDGFSVLITSESGTPLKLIHRNTAEYSKVIDALKNDDDLRELPVLDFKETVIVLVNTLGTLVPVEFNNEKYRKLLFSIDHPIPDDPELRVSPDTFYGYNLIFSLTEPQKEIVRFFKNSPRLVHISQPFLELLAEKISLDTVMFLYSTGNTLFLTVVRENTLLFHNMISIADGNDLVYHAMNCYRNIFNDQETLKVIYTGDLEKGSEPIEILGRYLGDVEFFPNFLGFELAGEFNENYFITLQQSIHCV